MLSLVGWPIAFSEAVLRSWMFNISPAPAALAKRGKQGLFLGQGHVLVFASAIRLGLERGDAALVIGHVRTVHRAQRHAHRRGDRGLRHPAFAQQHHLDALALRRW